ncbi:MAG: hypothetical protein WC890_03835 [Candidatus Margulisiibacteriota bacterium]
MNESYTNLMTIINMSPLFKGASVVLVGLLALLFAWFMKEKWKEPVEGGFKIFIVLSAFIVLFGLFILLFQPPWWKLPY